MENYVNYIYIKKYNWELGFDAWLNLYIIDFWKGNVDISVTVFHVNFSSPFFATLPPIQISILRQARDSK